MFVPMWEIRVPCLITVTAKSPRRSMRLEPTGRSADGLLQPCILDTLVDAMRTTPRGDVGWRLCPAKRDRQPCACALLAAREATVAPHAKSHKKIVPTPIAMWAQFGYVFRIRLESSPKQDRPNRVGNLRHI